MKNRGKAYHDAKESLPENMRDMFDKMVDDYEYISFSFTSRGWVSFKIIAAMVEGGWRQSAEPLPSCILLQDISNVDTQ